MELSDLNIPMLVLSLVEYFVILGVDVVATVGDRPYMKWLSYLNIALHILFLISLMFVGVELDLVVLLFMISLFTHTLSFYIRYYKAKRSSGADVGVKELSESPDSNADMTPEGGEVK